MRQTGERDVASFRNLDWGQVFYRQPEAPHETWMHIGDRTPIGLPTGSGNDLHLRVTDQPIDGFDGRVAGRANNSYTNHAVAFVEWTVLLRFI